MNEASAAAPGGTGEVVGLDSFLTLYYHIALGNDTDIVATFDDKPATLLLGRGQMAPTLEQAPLGMRKSGRTTFCLVPEHTSGPRNSELLQRVSLTTLRENSSSEGDYQPGDLAEFNAPNGGEYVGMLKGVGGTSVLLGFSHPLAGQTIVFEAQLIGVL